MLKVRLNCPICGIPVRLNPLEKNAPLEPLEGHLGRVHELTGMVLLRLHPSNPYTHEPEVELVPEPILEIKPEPEPEPAIEPEPEPAIEPEPEPAIEPEPEPAIEPEPE